MPCGRRENFDVPKRRGFRRIGKVRKEAKKTLVPDSQEPDSSFSTSRRTTSVLDNIMGTTTSVAYRWGSRPCIPSWAADRGQQRDHQRIDNLNVSSLNGNSASVPRMTSMSGW